MTQIRNVLLCTLATLTLAACGGESGSSSAAATAAADDGAAQVQANVGMIDRSAGIDENDGTATAATVASNTISNTGASGPGTSGSGTGTAGTGTTATAGSSGSGTTASTGSASKGGTTTVSTGSKATTPVKTVNGVATLDWMPPTENSDGSVLTNLAGYTVYYGSSPNDLSQSVKVSNPGLATYAVTGLSSGTWYFAVTSYSADGIESTRTGTVSTTI